jgi:catechol 2,3-dioxygenase-like lactoylglutathione lyase family enzyme
MSASACHHIALRVADVERSARFYVDVFGGRLLTRPYLREGPEAEATWGGLAGVSYRICHVALADGAIELFQIVEPRDLPAPRALDPAASQLHFAIRVDDVAAALAAVERAGGRRLWPEARTIGAGVSVIYVADLDENVIELTESTLEQITDLVVDAYPDADPRSG